MNAAPIDTAEELTARITEAATTLRGLAKDYPLRVIPFKQIVRLMGRIYGKGPVDAGYRVLKELDKAIAPGTDHTALWVMAAIYEICTEGEQRDERRTA